MGELLGKVEGLGALRASLRGIPTHPQGPGIIAQTHDARVHRAILIGQRVVLSRIIKCHRVLQVCAGQGGVAQIKPANSYRQMRRQEKCLILDALGELETLLAQLHGCLVFRAGER